MIYLQCWHYYHKSWHISWLRWQKNIQLLMGRRIYTPHKNAYLLDCDFMTQKIEASLQFCAISQNSLGELWPIMWPCELSLIGWCSYQLETEISENSRQGIYWWLLLQYMRRVWNMEYVYDNWSNALYGIGLLWRNYRTTGNFFSHVISWFVHR